MLIRDYNSLKMHQKASILGTVSVFLCNYRDDDFCASLYAFHNFYIEVLFDPKTNCLIEIVAFGDDERLDKYLDKISLASLV